jgi:hypothetical protein
MPSSTPVSLRKINWHTVAFLKERGVPVNYSAADLEADKATLDKILAQNPARRAGWSWSATWTGEASCAGGSGFEVLHERRTAANDFGLDRPVFKSRCSHSRQFAKFASTLHPCPSVIETPFRGLRSDTILTRKANGFRCEAPVNR